MNTYDVIVVGKGNAALCAALSAHDQGASVTMLEAANEDESGGNSRFAGGVMRFAYESVDDLKRVTDVTDEEIATSDFGTNTGILSPSAEPFSPLAAVITTSNTNLS